MRRLRGLITHFVILALCSASAGQTKQSARRAEYLKDRETAARIDRYVRSEMRKYQIPGVSLAVIRNGKISILKNYGLSNVELATPVRPETIFQSGSIGKQFTAAAVMVLAQDGKLALNDKISKYLPETPPAWKNITVWHLLTHTSGMGDYPDEINLRGDYTEDDYLNIFKKAPLNFAPGTSWDYSNVGYVTLGILISRVTGKSYGQFLQERVFGPLGMSTARVISEADIVPNRAAGYRLVDGALKNQEWVSPSTNSTADGSYYVSILDMAKWDAGLRSAAAAGSSVLTKATLEQMWAPARLSDGRVKGYGFGWFTDTIHNRRLVFHGGAWQGFKSFIIRFRDEPLTIIFLANAWQTNDFKLARGLISIFYPEFALDDRDPIPDSEPKATALMRRTLMQLKNDNADKEIFTTDFQAQLFPTQARQLGETLRTLSLPVAVIHLSELINRRDDGNVRTFTYRLTDIGQTLICTVTVTRDDKIAALRLMRK